MHEIVVGRDQEDLEKYKTKGTGLIGRHYVGEKKESRLTINVRMDLSRPHVIGCFGKRGSGKCVHGDTLIPLEDGSIVPIKDLENNVNKVYGLNNKLKISPIEKSYFYKRKVDKLLHVKFRSGKEIKITHEHPLFTMKGWTPTQNLNTGSRIATPRILPKFGNISMSEHEIKLLAYLIAEGHIKKIVLFSNSDNRIIKDFKDSLKKFDSSLKLIKDQKNHYRISSPNWKTQILKYEYSRNERGQFKKGIKNIHKKRSIRILLEREKIFGLLSRKKQIPESIMKLKKELLALFLNRLFSCDGSIYKSKTKKRGYWEISYSSSSIKLIRQVQHLLLRFGILSKLREKRVKCNEKYFKSFELVINSINILKFIQEIGFFGEKLRKQKKYLEEVQEILQNPNVDTIPIEIWDIYRPKNWVVVGKTFNYTLPKSLRSSINYSPSRQKLMQIAKIDQNESIYQLATSDIFWDEVVSIEELKGKFEVYDISVPEFHNFVANDIIIHNSYTLGVIAEELMELPEDIKKNTAGIMIDTMGIFWSMKSPNEKDIPLLAKWGMTAKNYDIHVLIPRGQLEEFKEKEVPFDGTISLRTSDLTLEDWSLSFNIGLDSEMGILLGRVIKKLKEQGENYSLKDIILSVKKENAENKVKEGLTNRFLLAEGWGIFSVKGSSIQDIIKPGKITVLDVSLYGYVSGGWSVRTLVVGLLARKILEERMKARRMEELEVMAGGEKSYMPITWMLIDEAHMFLPAEGKTAAFEPLMQWVKVGREPGVSLVLATQQPNKLHEDAISQCDLVISHRLTSKLDIDSLKNIMQTYLKYDLQEYIDALPRVKGAAIVLDDNSERLYAMRVRPRMSWHAGGSPIAVKELSK